MIELVFMVQSDRPLPTAKPCKHIHPLNKILQTQSTSKQNMQAQLKTE